MSPSDLTPWTLTLIYLILPCLSSMSQQTKLLWSPKTPSLAPLLYIIQDWTRLKNKCDVQGSSRYLVTWTLSCLIPPKARSRSIFSNIPLPCPFYYHNKVIYIVSIRDKNILADSANIRKIVFPLRLKQELNTKWENWCTEALTHFLKIETDSWTRLVSKK